MQCRTVIYSGFTLGKRNGTVVHQADGSQTNCGWLYMCVLRLWKEEGEWRKNVNVLHEGHVQSVVFATWLKACL